MAHYLYEVPINAILYDGNNYDEIINNCRRYNVQINIKPNPTNNSFTINNQHNLNPNQYLVFWPMDSADNFQPIIYDRDIFESRFRKFLWH